MSEMIDLSGTIVPKTDQLNADCLISGSITVKITKVVNKGTEQQPTWIYFEGDDGKPYKPCLGFRRALYQGWGGNGADYVGRQMTLYREPTVIYAGQEQGGIQISHMSHLEKDLRIMMTVSRGKKKAHTIKRIETEPENVLTDEEFDTFKTDLEAAETMADLQAVQLRIKSGRYDLHSRNKLIEIYNPVRDKIRAT